MEKELFFRNCENGRRDFYTQPERVTGHIEYYDMLKLIRGKKVDFYRNIMEEEDDMYAPLIKFMKRLRWIKYSIISSFSVLF